MSRLDKGAEPKALPSHICNNIRKRERDDWKLQKTKVTAKSNCKTVITITPGLRSGVSSVHWCKKKKKRLSVAVTRFLKSPFLPPCCSQSQVSKWTAEGVEVTERMPEKKKEKCLIPSSHHSHVMSTGGPECSRTLRGQRKEYQIIPKIHLSNTFRFLSRKNKKAVDCIYGLNNKSKWNVNYSCVYLVGVLVTAAREAASLSHFQKPPPPVQQTAPMLTYFSERRGGMWDTCKCNICFVPLRSRSLAASPGKVRLG